MKNHFENIVCQDEELSQGLNLILKKEGLSSEALDAFFEKKEDEFIRRINYRKAREAVIYNIYCYSNAAVVVALMVVFVVLPILGHATSETFENIGPYDLGKGFKIAP